MREEWLEGARVVGISSGASAPEELVERLVDYFRARGTTDVEEFEVLREDVRFMLPKQIRQATDGRRRGLIRPAAITAPPIPSPDEAGDREAGGEVADDRHVGARR